MASLSLSATSSSITATITGLDTNHAYTRYYEWYLNGSYVSQNSTAPYAGSASYIYNGLNASTTYSITVEIYHTDWTLMSTLTGSVITASSGGGGGGGSDTWWCNADGSAGTISSGGTWNYSTYSAIGQVNYVAVSFATSGTATFYTQGSLDTYGYLSTSSSFNSSTGAPAYYLDSDDDSRGNGNMQITYNVSAGTTYYLWVRPYSSSGYGSTTVYISAPGSVSGGSGFHIYHNGSWCNAVPYIYHSGSWCQATSNLYHSGWNSAT